MKTYILQLTSQEVSLLSEALGNMPFVKIVALITNLQQQISQQDRAEVPVDPV